MAHVERVIMTEMGGVIGVGNAAMLPPAAAVASDGLRLLPGVLWRRFLCTLWLRLLCVLRLLLVLRRLGFPFALLPLLFLCKCRKGRCERYKHYCCADDWVVLHKCR